jgi:hypothetical protein
VRAGSAAAQRSGSRASSAQSTRRTIRTVQYTVRRWAAGLVQVLYGSGKACSKNPQHYSPGYSACTVRSPSRAPAVASRPACLLACWLLLAA